MLETLLKLGLSEKEAKVYIAALALGSAPAAKIAQKADLNRPTTYVILEKLAQIGLITTYEQGKVQFFSAEDPEQLRRLVEREELALKERMAELTQRLPEFKALFDKSDRPRVLLYDSIDSATDYFFNRVKANEKIYAFTNFDVLEATAQTKAQPAIRLKKKIATRVIYTSTKGEVEGANSQVELREAKFVPLSEFPFHSGGVTIAPESGVIFMEEPHSHTTVVVENPVLAASLYGVFQLIWSRI